MKDKIWQGCLLLHKYENMKLKPLFWIIQVFVKTVQYLSRKKRNPIIYSFIYIFFAKIIWCECIFVIQNIWRKWGCGSVFFTAQEQIQQFIEGYFKPGERGFKPYFPIYSIFFCIDRQKGRGSNKLFLFNCMIYRQKGGFQ